MSDRKYPSNSVKIMIMSDHGGRCALCGLSSGKRIYTNSKEQVPLDSFDIGQFAHIYSESRKGPRYDSTIPKEFLASKENFLLLCINHHSFLDDNYAKYDAKKLRQIRQEHVKLIDSKLSLQNIERVILITVWDDYFGKLNTSTIPGTLRDNECVINYLDFHTTTENTENINWIKECEAISRKWKEFNKEFYANVSSLVDGFHLYSITQIPFAFFIGLLLKETNKLFAHQWNREEQKWEGHAGSKSAEDIFLAVDIIAPDQKDLIFKVELTSRIDPADIRKLNLDIVNEITIRTSNPSRLWLKSVEQTDLVLAKYRDAIRQINDLPTKKVVRLFYAGPIPPLVKMGAAYNPRIDPPIVIYYYGVDSKSGEKGYTLAYNTIDILRTFKLL